MNVMRWSNLLMIVSGFSALGMSFHGGSKAKVQEPDPQAIFKQHCDSCHSGDKPAGGLDLTKSNTDISAMWIVAKGDPDHSLVMRRITGKLGRPMPPSGPALSDADQNTIRDWITSLNPDPAAIFKANCVKCHTGPGAPGHLDLTKSKWELSSSPDIVKGNPAASTLIKRVMARGAGQMPPGNTPLSDADTKALTTWVANLNDPTPIIFARCMPCHRGGNPAGGLDLAKTPVALAERPEIKKGDPDNSSLIKRLTMKGAGQMPPGGHALSDDEIAFISNWVRDQK